MTTIGKGPVALRRGAGQRAKVHGRRLGRPLRKGQQALLNELLPRLKVALPEEPGSLDPRTLFDRPVGAVWLEIGFGGGEHLAWQAEHNPGVGLIGAEVFLNGLATLLRRVDDEGLENLRLHPDDARALVAALAEGSLERVFVLFPDPWPKAKHHKRRLVQRRNLDVLARTLADGAELRLATDDPGYLRWMMVEMSAHPDFEWLARAPGDWRRRPADWPATRYEMKALSQGRTPAYLRYRRRPRRES